MPAAGTLGADTIPPFAGLQGSLVAGFEMLDAPMEGRRASVAGTAAEEPLVMVGALKDG